MMANKVDRMTIIDGGSVVRMSEVKKTEVISQVTSY